MSKSTIDAKGWNATNGKVRLAISLPNEIFKFVKAEAIDNRRSLSNQIVVMLEDWKKK